VLDECERCADCSKPTARTTHADPCLCGPGVIGFTGLISATATFQGTNRVEVRYVQENMNHNAPINFTITIRLPDGMNITNNFSVPPGVSWAQTAPGILTVTGNGTIQWGAGDAGAGGW